MEHFLIYFCYSIFKTVKVVFHVFFVLPLFYLKGKVYRLNKVKREMFSAINRLYNLNLNDANYHYNINLAPGFSISNSGDKDLNFPASVHYVIKGSHGVRFATSQIDDNGLSFKINVNNSQVDNFGFPVVFELKTSLDILSKRFNINHSLIMFFKSGHLKEVKIDLELMAKDKGVFIERLDPPVKKVLLSISLDMESDMKLDYTAYLSSFMDTKEHKNSLPLNELLQLIRLEVIDDLDVIKDIVEILPELKIPSAYDFTSEDFKQRLLLVEMFQY